jgi:POT family proton-dependent oligopeptide transporter
MNHGAFFALIGAVAGLSAALLYMLSRRHRGVGQHGPADGATVPAR